MNALFRHIILGITFAAVALAMTSCTRDGHLTLFGYTSRPNYDPSIRTVRVPIFKNETFRRRIEFDLHKAVIREIEARTPFKAVAAGSPADTELTGRIVSRNKNLVIYNQLGEIRDAETTLTVELVWKDLRLPQPDDRPMPQPGDGPLPPVFAPPQPAPKVIVQSMGTFRPELGESLTTAEQRMIDRMAVRIVNMMEKPF